MHAIKGDLAQFRKTVCFQRRVVTHKLELSQASQY